MAKAAADTETKKLTARDIIELDRTYTAEAFEFEIGIPADMIRRQFCHDTWPDGTPFCSATRGGNQFFGRDVIDWV